MFPINVFLFSQQIQKLKIFVAETMLHSFQHVFKYFQHEKHCFPN